MPRLSPTYLPVLPSGADLGDGLSDTEYLSCDIVSLTHVLLPFIVGVSGSSGCPGRRGFHRDDDTAANHDRPSSAFRGNAMKRKLHGQLLFAISPLIVLFYIIYTGFESEENESKKRQQRGDFQLDGHAE